MSNTTAYVQQTWVDHQQDPVTGDVLVQGSSMDAEHFNHMEAGIKAADTVAREAAAGLGDKAPAIHTHDERYYTETEMNTLLADKSGTGHTHTPASLGAAPDNHSHTPASIGAAPASHTHGVADISGVLPVAKGGTGATSLANVSVGYANGAGYANGSANADKWMGYTAWQGTQAQYDAIPSKSASTIYFIVG